MSIVRSSYDVTVDGYNPGFALHLTTYEYEGEYDGHGAPSRIPIDTFSNLLQRSVTNLAFGAEDLLYLPFGAVRLIADRDYDLADKGRLNPEDVKSDYRPGKGFTIPMDAVLTPLVVYIYPTETSLLSTTVIRRTEVEDIRRRCKTLDRVNFYCVRVSLGSDHKFFVGEDAPKQVLDQIIECMIFGVESDADHTDPGRQHKLRVSNMCTIRVACVLHE